MDTRVLLLPGRKKRGTPENSPVRYASFFVGSLRLSYDDLRPVGFFVGLHFRFGFLGIRLFVDDAEYFSRARIGIENFPSEIHELFNIFSPRDLAQMVTSGGGQKLCISY